MGPKCIHHDACALYTRSDAKYYRPRFRGRLATITSYSAAGEKPDNLWPGATAF
jgi:hypothetical protein